MRFQLFGGSIYYPQGGMCDRLPVAFTDGQTAITWARGYLRMPPEAAEPPPGCCDWVQVYDSLTQKVVFDSRGEGYINAGA